MLWYSGCRVHVKRGLIGTARRHIEFRVCFDASHGDLPLLLVASILDGE
jgi:hypothetical protein